MSHEPRVVDQLLVEQLLARKERVLRVDDDGDLPLVVLVILVERRVLAPDDRANPVDHPAEGVPGRVVDVVDLTLVLVGEVSAARELLLLVVCVGAGVPTSLWMSSLGIYFSPGTYSLMGKSICGNTGRD